MRAYHRIDPLMDERKSHYTPAQFGAFLKVQLVAGRQTMRGWFRSEAALRGALPGAYARHVDFLIEQGDLRVSDSGVYVDGWNEWQEGDLTVSDRMAALRNRRRNATVTGTVTSAVSEPSPTAIRSSVGSSVSVSSKASPTDRTPARGNGALPVTLTKGQLEGWESFGPEWRPFKAAWLARGFRYPPSGDPGDETSQRSLLWQIVDARPTGIAEWIRSAPKDATPRAVIQYALDRFHEIRAAVSDRPVERDLAPTKHEAAQSVGAIIDDIRAKASA